MLKKYFLTLIVVILLPGIIYMQEAGKKSVAVTVYNDNLGVVKEVSNISIPSGKSQITVTDVAQFIDPTSVHIKLNGEVIEQNYQYDLVNLDKILQKYIDKKIQIFSKDDKLIEGVLLSSQGGQVVLRKDDGGLIMLPNTQEYRISVGSLPEGLITKPTLVWLVNSTSSKSQNVEISYQTSGMNWHAEYVAVLNEDDSKLDLKSWVSVENNSGTKYDDAVLKLVAGNVNLVSPRAGQGFEAQGARTDMVYKAAVPQFQEKQFFEYHIYNLTRPVTLSNNETKQISLFETEGVNVIKKFLYRSSNANYGQDNPNKVAVIVEFENKEKNNMGMPLPKGTVRMYKSDGNNIEFIGEDMIDHTPREEKVKLKIGEAFDIVVEDTQTEQKRISDRVNENSYEIKIKNRKKENITVEVEKFLGTNWEILSSSVNYEKKNAQTALFRVPVNKNEESVLKFKVRYSY
jgi:hypothetical protein